VTVYGPGGMPGQGLNESGQGRPIRAATAADVDAIERLVERAYGGYVERLGIEPGPMRDDYSQRIAEADAFVVVDEGAVIALLILVARPDHLLIENIAVDPSRQGEGIGRRLMTFAEERARATELTRLRLYTHELMSENLALYARLGYREDERRDVRVFLSKDLGLSRDACAGCGRRP